MAPPDDPRVVQALEAYLLELEAGGRPDRAALLLEYADVAGPLADCLDGLDFLRTAGTPDDVGPLDAVPVGLGQLGDFRLVREIGRGGMGVVYEAEDVRLGRRVAVKTLPAAAGLRPADLRRFRHEARAAALLAHPHIVPVYSVGADAGVPFFAMRLVRGRSLAELLDRPRPPRTGRAGSTRPHPGPADRTAADGSPPAPVVVPVPAGPGPELPDCPTAVAGLAAQALDALHHAHTAGVVHRDVKPGNLLLDDTGHLWVADFGLAHLPGGSRLTAPGARVGTLRYMSPEQADPARGVIDHRADLYGLGATLYELLLGRPVVDASDAGTAVSRILTQDPVPPRRLDPRVPRDLETVVLKLLAKDPADRYPTAAAAADDLRRFVAGRPVLARRPGPSERVARWAVRHRRPVAAAFAGLLLLAGLLAVGLVRVQRERDAARAARQQARAAADVFYTRIAEQWLAHQPGADAVEREFLLKAQEQYDRLATTGDGSRDDRLLAAVARRRVADIAARLGDLPTAEAAFADAGDRLRLLAAPDWPEAVREAAVCATDHGTLLRSLQRLDEASNQFRRAADGFRSLVGGGSADPFDRAGLAGLENNQGLLWQDQGQWAEAEACHRAARTRFARLAADSGDRPVWLAETANCGHNLADALAAAGRPAEAERAFREALTLRRRVLADAPGLPAHRRELHRTQTALASLLGRGAEAAGLAAEAAAGWNGLALAFPHFPGYKVEQAWGLRTVAEIAAADRPADALAAADRAADILRSLADAPGAAGELARACHLAAGLHVAAGRPAAAEAARQEARAAAARAGDRLPFDRHTHALLRTPPADPRRPHP